MSKKFTISTTCPSCGHARQEDHDAQAMHSLYGNNANIQVLCTQCQANFEQPVELACAEWDDYCREIPLPADV